jgi:Ser/Thr protein kinase RdoA (MazF antagonist)
MTPDLSQIAARFAMSGSFAEARPLGRGHVHDTYRVTADDGSAYTLQRINRRVFPDPGQVMRNVVRVTEHLAARLGDRPDAARRHLRVVASRDGSPGWIDAHGEVWRMYRFIEGVYTLDPCPDPRSAYAAARAFGEFLDQLGDLDAADWPETIPFFHHTGRRVAALRRSIERNAAGRRPRVAAEIEFALSRADRLPPLAEWLESGRIPRRLSHNDTKINNVLFDRATGQGLCVIDLDTCMPGSALYDFGDMARTMTSPTAEDETDRSKIGLDAERFEALTRGFIEGMAGRLTAGEAAHLPDAGRVMTYTVGIRFLTDYLDGDVYFKVHRPDHNLDRCRAQFALLESMERQRDEMDRIVDTIRTSGR